LSQIKSLKLSVDQSRAWSTPATVLLLSINQQQSDHSDYQSEASQEHLQDAPQIEDITAQPQQSTTLFIQQMEAPAATATHQPQHMVEPFPMCLLHSPTTTTITRFATGKKTWKMFLMSSVSLTSFFRLRSQDKWKEMHMQGTSYLAAVAGLVVGGHGRRWMDAMGVAYSIQSYSCRKSCITTVLL
jgi:hypothetical protein